MILTENQLDEWVRGSANEAQGVIVELIWRLVAAACPKPRERRFPLGDSIGQHGPDGLLDVDLEFKPFVPEGRSYWEIGTGQKAAKKATDDYNGLVDETPETVRLESTFIFVTPLSGRRDWPYTWKDEAQASWLEKRRNRNEWRDVRIIDGTRLIDWLHQFPSVERWLAQKTTGVPEDKIETLEERWKTLREIGKPPPLSPKVFLANRDEANAKIKEVFAGTAIQLKLETRYPNHVADFVSACLADLDDEARVDAAGRCLVVSDVDTWNALTRLPEKHILIADATLDLNGDRGTQLIQKARRVGHAVVFGGTAGGIPDTTAVPLLAPRAHQIKDALEKCGYREERARTLAQKSAGNLGSLLRCLQNLSLMPEWAYGSAAAELAIASALGSWEEKSDSDREIVEVLSGKEYGEWIGKIREITLRPGTPLIQRDGNWRFISRFEGWYALGPRLFDEHIDRLTEAAVSVLTEQDPQFELPPEERYAASIHGKVLSHSQSLRNGLAEALALLGNHPKALKSCTQGKRKRSAVLAVRAILSRADWRRWAGLSDLLPFLAEAAPSEFLDAVEEALGTDPCPFDELFTQQEVGGLVSHSYMSGVLWALETLAWDANHLIRVVMCLGELAARDPGGRWVNQPGNSLRTILLPGMPQTCAPIAKRSAAVKSLCTELRGIGWRLLMSLLPEESYSISWGTRRPAWRETIPEDWSTRVTPAEYLQQVEHYAGLAIAAAKDDINKLTELIGHLANLPPSQHDEVLEHLCSDTMLGMPESDRLRVWTALVDLVTEHRKFVDADWALEPEQVDKIAAVADHIAPTAPMFRHQRLFSERDFFLKEEKGDYREHLKDLELRRQRAIEEVAATEGTQAVFSFAAVVQSPWRVGLAFGKVACEEDDPVVMPALLEAEDKALVQFASGFIWSKFQRFGWKWIDQVNVSNWTPFQIAQFLSFLPFVQDTWARAKELLGEEEGAYWEITDANPYDGDGGLEHAIEALVQHGRPCAALRCIVRRLHEKQSVDTRLAVQALLAAPQSSEGARAADGYDIRETIKFLQDHPGTDTNDLCRVEFSYLQLLDRGDASPKLLWRRLATEPAFYCEAIRLVFRSKIEEHATEEPTEEKRTIAGKAYRLLSRWKTPPGCQADGTFNGEEFRQWLEFVRKECSESGHLEVAMTMLGHALVHVPPDSEGLWVHRSAAAALNGKDAKDMRIGFRSELYNSRGIHSVDPTGKPEMELAANYHEKADSIEEAGFHRLAATLRELASSYEREAERIVRDARSEL